MRDAIGGTLTIQIIVIFLIIVNSYLAFSVNYTKAFRVKNQIISIIEKNEGPTRQAEEEIKEYMDKVSYSASYLNSCSSLSKDDKQGEGKEWKDVTYKVGAKTSIYCYAINKQDSTGGTDEEVTYAGSYYSVATFVDINIPVLKTFFGEIATKFAIKGETKMIYSSGNNSELSE